MDDRVRKMGSSELKRHKKVDGKKDVGKGVGKVLSRVVSVIGHNLYPPLVLSHLF